MKIVDIVSADDKVKLKFIGIGPIEKLHEQMISKEDAAYTFEYEDYYKILPATVSPEIAKARTIGAKRVHDGFCYSSDQNSDWMPKDRIQKWLRKMRVPILIVTICGGIFGTLLQKDNQ